MAIVGDLTGGWPIQNEETKEWDWSKAKAMTQDAENANIWTLTLKSVIVEGKKYEYKAAANSKWGDYELPAEGSNADFVFGTEEFPAGWYNLTFTVNTEENTMTLEAEPITHTWNFAAWSAQTIENLKAEAVKVTVEDDPDNAGKTKCTDNGALWSDHEKASKCDTYGASKDNCFWYVGGEANPTANGVAIAELKGLEFNTTYGTARSLAIAVNYPETSLGSYKGGAYLWLGGKGKDCFTIKNVKVGSTLTIGAESHKPAEGRGIQLKINGENFGDAFTPKTFDENSWTITSSDADAKYVDVVVSNTNGCHIYFIDAEVVELPVEDGYYLAGSMNNWTPTATEELKPNTEAEGEYMLTLDMTANTEIKVVKVENNAIAAWYPAEGNNYVVAEDANYTVYFRPNGNSEWENGFFYVANNASTGIATIKAMQENGTAVYNLNGQRINVAGKGLYIVNGRKVVVK